MGLSWGRTRGLATAFGPNFGECGRFHSRSLGPPERWPRAGGSVVQASRWRSWWARILAIGLWAVVRPSEIRRRVPRTVAMGIGSVAVAAWILVPLISDQWAAMSSTFNLNTDFADSFGWRKVLGFIFTGDINDNGRWPVVSIAAAVGLVVAIRNWGTAPIRWARELPLLLLAGTILFIGRNPFGWLIDLLPGSSMVFLHDGSIQNMPVKIRSGPSRRCPLRKPWLDRLPRRPGRRGWLVEALWSLSPRR